MLERILSRAEIKMLDSSEKKILNLNGEDVEIDTMIAELIEKLNKKGFTTKYCCSGHDEDAYTTGYVAFDSSVNSDILEMIGNIRNLETEHMYNVYSKDTNVFLTNPSGDEIAMSERLASLKGDDYFVQDMLIARITTYKEIYRETAERGLSRDEYIKLFSLRNKIQAYLAFQIFMDLVDSYGTEKYNDNLERLKEHNENLRNKGYGDIYYPYNTVYALRD